MCKLKSAGTASGVQEVFGGVMKPTMIIAAIPTGSRASNFKSVA